MPRTLVALAAEKGTWERRPIERVAAPREQASWSLRTPRSAMLGICGAPGFPGILLGALVMRRPLAADLEVSLGSSQQAAAEAGWQVDVLEEVCDLRILAFGLSLDAWARLVDGHGQWSGSLTSNAMRTTSVALSRC